MEAAGLLSLHSGQAGQALQPLRAAATAWEGMGRPYDAARTLLDLGLALQAAGDSLQAAACLDRAHTSLEALAGELPDEATRAAFLQSQIVRQVQQARGALPAAG
jgi:hypothetical protein